MTIEEYCDWLSEKALGWLGWTEKETLNADVNAIEIAYRGRIDMLQAIFGSADKTPKGPSKDARGQPVTLTPNSFDNMFDTKPTKKAVKLKQ